MATPISHKKKEIFFFSQGRKFSWHLLLGAVGSTVKAQRSANDNSKG